MTPTQEAACNALLQAASAIQKAKSRIRSDDELGVYDELGRLFNRCETLVDLITMREDITTSPGYRGATVTGRTLI